MEKVRILLFAFCHLGGFRLIQIAQVPCSLFNRDIAEVTLYELEKFIGEYHGSDSLKYPNLAFIRINSSIVEEKRGENVPDVSNVRLFSFRSNSLLIFNTDSTS